MSSGDILERHDFAEGEAVRIGNRVYFASPAAGAKPPGDQQFAVRVRRVPQIDDETVWNGIHATNTKPTKGPVLVIRDNVELPSTLVFPEERLCDSLDISTPNLLAPQGPADNLPLAYARGAPLLSPEEGGTTLHATLPEALASTASSATLGLRGTIFANGTAERFESYRQLRVEALRMLGALQLGGLQPGDRAIFQCTHVDRQLHLHAIWGCAIGGM
jgi:hypothetical protein